MPRPRKNILADMVSDASEHINTGEYSLQNGLDELQNAREILTQALERVQKRIDAIEAAMKV